MTAAAPASSPAAARRPVPPGVTASRNAATAASAATFSLNSRVAKRNAGVPKANSSDAHTRPAREAPSHPASAATSPAARADAAAATTSVAKTWKAWKASRVSTGPAAARHVR